MAAAKPRFLPLIRELARCYQAFEALSAAHVRELGLTPAQFDIIATLGNTQGMSFKELGEKTLITKGTLTGVVDRLAARDLVRRVACPTDGRSQLVQLTAAGQALFAQVFPDHVQHMERALGRLSRKAMTEIEDSLRRLREAMANGVRP